MDSNKMLENKLKDILSSYILTDYSVLSLPEMESLKYEKNPNDIDWPFFIQFNPYVCFPVSKMLFCVNSLTGRAQIDLYPAQGIIYKRERLLLENLSAAGFGTVSYVFAVEKCTYLEKWLLIKM